MRLLLPSGTCRGSFALYLLWCCVLEELTVSAALSARRGPRTVNVTALSALADDDDLDFDVDTQTPSTRRDDPRARVPALPRPSSAPAGAAEWGDARRGARAVPQQMEMVAPAALGARGTPRRQRPGVPRAPEAAGTVRRQEPYYNSSFAGPPPGPPRPSDEHQDGTLNSTSATSATAPSDPTSATTEAAASNKKSASAIRAKKYYYASSASADSPRASGKKVIGDILFTAADVHEQHPHLERLHQLIQKHRPKYETKELPPSNAYGNSPLGGFLTPPATPKIKTVLRKILHLVATDPFEQLAVREEVVGVFNDLRRSLIADRWFTMTKDQFGSGTTVVPDYATYLSMKEIEAVLEFFIFLKGSHPIQGPRVSEALRYMFSEAERERERGQKLNGQGRGAGAPSSSSTSSLRSAGVAAPKSTLRGGLRREASVASVVSLPVPARSSGGTEAAVGGGGSCHPSSPAAIRGPTTVERLLMQELYGSAGDDERRTAAPSIPTSTSGTGGAFLSARNVETLTAGAAAAPGGGGGGDEAQEQTRGITVLGDHGNANAGPGGVLGNKTNNTSAANSSTSSCSTEESEIDFILSWTRQRKAAIWTKLMTERNWQSLDFRTERLKRITRVDQRLGTPLDRVTAFLSEVSLYFATVREQEEWAILVNGEKENDEKQKAEAEPPADDMDEGPAVVDQRLAVAALARQNPTTASTTGGVQEPLVEQSGNTGAAAALSVYAAPSTAQQHDAMVHAIHTPPPTPEAPNRSPASPSSTHGAGADPRAAAAIQPYRGHAGADHNQPKRQRHSTPSRTAGGASAAGSTATDSHLIRHTTGLGGLFGWPFFQPTAAAHAHRPSPGSTGARSEVGGMGGGIEGMVGGSSAAMPPEGLAGLHI